MSCFVSGAYTNKNAPRTFMERETEYLYHENKERLDKQLYTPKEAKRLIRMILDRNHKRLHNSYVSFVKRFQAEEPDLPKALPLN